MGRRDDTDAENGCLWVIPESHAAGRMVLLDKVKSGSREIRMKVDESRAIPVPLKAGEWLLMHCWTLHKSGPNQSIRDRRMLFMRYADADAIEAYNEGRPRLGRLLPGVTRVPDVEAYEAERVFGGVLQGG
jgi:ectoine hydroxylase-related dioxygenase (phytanoyl-CoA dioxygenase family)